MTLRSSHGLLGGLGVVGVGVREGKLGERRLRWEEQTIAEGVLGIDVVTEDDVGDLEGEESVEVAHLLRAVGGDDGGGVDEALGDEDGVTDGDRLEGLGEQRADADGAIDGNLVVGQDVVGQLGENLVEVAGSVDEAGRVEALDDVVLSLLNPLALGAERAEVAVLLAFVGGTFDFEVGLILFLGGNLQRVAPDLVDGLELQAVRGALGVGFFDVGGGGEPEAILHVGADGVEVEVLVDVVLLAAGEVAVVADDVAAADARPRCGRRSGPEPS